MPTLLSILEAHWVMALALPDVADADDGAPQPYPAPLFYALARPDSIGEHTAPLLIFTGSPNSHHSELIGDAPTPAAAALYLETETVGSIRGAQLRGLALCASCCTPGAQAGLRRTYLARHPIAHSALEGGHHQLYALQITWAKLTDNKLGFGVHPSGSFDAAWTGLA